MEVLMLRQTIATAVFLLVGSPTLMPDVVAQQYDVAQQARVGADCGKCDGGTAGGFAYTLVVQHSSKCLDVPHSSNEDGIALAQYACHGTPNQRFTLRQMPNNYFEIVAQHSQKCLDVFNGRTDDLAPVAQYACHGGDNQLFRLFGDANQGALIVAKNSGKCLDVLMESTEDAAAVIQYSCHGGRNQRWRLVR
jgi:hypothetical protein